VQERDKMLGTISDMEAMVDSTLNFARDETLAEPKRPTDLTALLQSTVDDMSEAGLSVDMKPAEPVVHECRPGALKRAVTNIIDNAMKYGAVAHVSIETTPELVQIAIDDEGPGIPEQELVRVFEPFYRLENSRNQETGGIGLGLAIAQSIIQSHGGSLTLINRQKSGLRAIIGLPR
jgi:signal transduction histidine kinase